MTTLDELFARIADKIRDHAAHLDKARQRLSITVRRNAYPERAVSHFFLRALADSVPEETTVLELALSNAESKRTNNHLDAIVFNDDIAILAEFKRGWVPSHWNDLAEDADRVHRRFAQEIERRFLMKERRPRLFGFYGIDAWRDPIASAWDSGERYRGWSLPNCFTSMKRGFQVVWQDDTGPQQGKDFDGYYLLFALEELSA